MSLAPPGWSPAAPAAVGADDVLPLGRPVRRRIAAPLLLAAGLAVVLALWMFHDSVVYFRVDSGSMQPTLPTGSRVAVEPGLPVRVGEIVAFHAPAGAIPDTPVCGAPGQGQGFPQPCGLATPQTAKAVFVKRVVAGPRSLVSISAGRTVVNGVISHEPFASACETGVICDFQSPVRVPAGQYYVLGDNRADSDDSRFWGPIPASSIVGVVVTCGPLQTACRPRR